MSADATVETPGGRLRGLPADGALQFLGIPYAGAPRFVGPQLPAPWPGIRDATQYGPAAPQPRRPIGTFTHGELPATDEHCLYLNVYTPSLAGRRPVLVWLHGGGFAIGHAGASIYRGARLAVSADVVVVTANYRLGSLGWLYHPELRLEDGAPGGNWGLLDQIAALEWVCDTIAAFGGDPGRVTLAGQSAGALSAIDLLVSPGAAGLFHRAIVQSPPLGDLAGPPERARRWAEDLSRLAGGAGFDASLLRSLPADRIVALHEELLTQPGWRGTRGGALPTLDPASLPRSPLEDPGASGDVEILIGTTREEGTFFVSSPWRPAPEPSAIPEVAAHLTGVRDASALIERYRARARERDRSDDPVALLVDIATDALVARPTVRWAAARAEVAASAGGRMYLYRVDHRGAGPTLGATHTAEVPLLFGTWDDGGPGERLGGRGTGTAEVAGELVRAWARFVHGGGPGWQALVPGGATSEVGVFGGAGPLSIERQELGRGELIAET